MGKTWIKEVTITDQNGVIQPGETVRACPFGTTSNYTNAANQGDGTYRFTFDFVANGDGSIARFYDAYCGAVKKFTKVPWGDAWYWIVKFALTTASEAVLFSDATMKDENNESLPTNILNAKIMVMYQEKDLPVFIHTVSDTGFTIEASTGGGDKLPVDVWLKIFPGEA